MVKGNQQIPLYLNALGFWPGAYGRNFESVTLPEAPGKCTLTAFIV